MVSSLDHRGPDDAGTWDDPSGHLYLGFRRLSILDLSQAGHQPMESASGRYHVVFNGELYNFRSLRDELIQSGFTFRGRSDTEVLLAAIECWGAQRALERFRGMFAFALFDDVDRLLWLARDRMGIKPLYMLHKDRGLAFASEARAFHSCPLFSGNGDVATARRFLTRLYVPGTDSILAGVEKVEPGQVVRFRLDADGVEEVDRIRYWDLPAVVAASRADRVSDPMEAVDGLHELLRESVRMRLVADVPVGSFLSGGIDSTAVVAIMQEASSKPVKTFTVSFDDPDFDEAPVARAVADHLGTDHTSVMLPSEDVLELARTLPELSDEPMANPSLLPTALVSRVARASVVVALSGDGGDELFGGYNRYRLGAGLIRRSQRIPPPFRSAAGRAIDGLLATRLTRAAVARAGGNGVGQQHSMPARLRKVARVLTASDEQGAYEGLLDVGVPRALLARSNLDLAALRQRPVWQGDRTEDRMMLMDQLEYLPDDLLTKVDRASMWESLEARVPILDHRVVEFSWRLPIGLKIRNGNTKWPLRRIAERYVPSELLDRPKMGFTVPVAKWLRSDLREWARDTLHPESTSDLWKPSRLTDAWRRFESGQEELGLPLWAAAVLEGWSRSWNVRFDS